MRRKRDPDDRITTLLISPLVTAEACVLGAERQGAVLSVLRKTQERLRLRARL